MTGTTVNNFSVTSKNVVAFDHNKVERQQNPLYIYKKEAGYLYPHFAATTHGSGFFDSNLHTGHKFTVTSRFGYSNVVASDTTNCGSSPPRPSIIFAHNRWSGRQLGDLATTNCGDLVDMTGVCVIYCPGMHRGCSSSSSSSISSRDSHPIRHLRWRGRQQRQQRRRRLLQLLLLHLLLLLLLLHLLLLLLLLPPPPIAWATPKLRQPQSVVTEGHNNKLW